MMTCLLLAALCSSAGCDGWTLPAVRCEVWECISEDFPVVIVERTETTAMEDVISYPSGVLDHVGVQKFVATKHGLQYTPDQFGMMSYDVPSPVSMLGGTVQEDESDNTSSRLDLGLGIISLSAAMIATGLTSSCLAAKTCHETVTITKWAFDRGPIWGVVGRAGVNGLIHYAVARWIPKGKWRTATLATLAVINVTNAALDIRTLREIERRP